MDGGLEERRRLIDFKIAVRRAFRFYMDDERHSVPDIMLWMMAIGYAIAHKNG